MPWSLLARVANPVGISTRRLSPRAARRYSRPSLFTTKKRPSRDQLGASKCRLSVKTVTTRPEGISTVRSELRIAPSDWPSTLLGTTTLDSSSRRARDRASMKSGLQTACLEWPGPSLPRPRSETHRTQQQGPQSERDHRGRRRGKDEDPAQQRNQARQRIQPHPIRSRQV